MSLLSPTEGLPTFRLGIPSNFSNAIASKPIMEFPTFDSDFSDISETDVERPPRLVSSSVSSSTSYHKRKVPFDTFDLDLQFPVVPQPKRSRHIYAETTDEPLKHVPKTRPQSRQQILAPSPEPIYRSSRSRSTSSFPSSNTYSSVQRRHWSVDDDGTPGPKHVSSETVVKKLMKTYKGCGLLFSGTLAASYRSFAQILITLTTRRIDHFNRIPIVTHT